MCVRVSSWDSPGWKTLGLGPPRLSPSQPRMVPEARSSGLRREGEVLVGPSEALLPKRHYKVLDGHTGRAPPCMTSTRDLQSPRHRSPSSCSWLLPCACLWLLYRFQPQQQDWRIPGGAAHSPALPALASAARRGDAASGRKTN